VRQCVVGMAVGFGLEGIFPVLMGDKNPDGDYSNYF